MISLFLKEAFGAWLQSAISTKFSQPWKISSLNDDGENDTTTNMLINFE